MNLPKFAVERKSLVLAATTLFAFWSLASFATMQRREDPGIEQRQTEVVTILPGATTENVEQLITKKLVDDLRSVQHVDHVTGTSRPGISDIHVEFDDAMTQSDGPLRDVRNKVADARGELPPGIAGPTLVDDFWDTYPVIVGISAPDADDRRLRDIAKALSDRIAALPDVGRVKMVGAQEQQIDVDVDTRALSLYGLGALDVANALGARNALVPNGTLALGSRISQVDPNPGLGSLPDVAAAPVASVGGRPVRVADVARVHAASPDPPNEIVHLDGERAVALAVAAKETSSVTDLGPEISRALDAARASWPAGVKAELVADQPRSVSDRVNDFFVNLGLGVLLSTIIVALLMGLRNGLLVGFTVLLSCVLTFGEMPLVHIDVNQMSILGLIIALGVIVDAGIVAVDNIERRLRDGLPARDAAWRGVSELWFPLLTSTLVGMSSFVPFRLMGGPIGDFVHDLSVVPTFALINSLLVAYFITPIAGEWFARPSTGDGGFGSRARAWFDRGLAGLQRGYVPLATAALRVPALTMGIVGLVLVGAVLFVPHLGVQFFPSADRNQFFVEVTAPDGTDIRTTEGIVRNVERQIAAQDGVTTFSSYIGAGAPRFYYNVLSEQPNSNYSQIIVDTTDVAATGRIIPALRAAIAEHVAGARIEVKPLEQGPPVGAPISFRLQASDAAALRAPAAQLQALLRTIAGATAVRDSLGVPTTKLAVDVDRARATQLGISDASIAQVLALAYGGDVATQMREADRQTPVVVRLPDALRHDASALAGTAVRTQSGAAVPLGELATVKLEGATSASTYRDGLPTIVVSSNVVGRLPSEVLADFKRAAANVALPAGVTLGYAGEEEQTNRAFAKLGVAAIVGLLLNQTLLLWEFRRLRLSLVILSAVPLGLIGAVAGLGLTGNHFGFVAFLGLASLGGIVTNHTIVLFEYALRELEHDPTLGMARALVEAGTKRLRPILLTVVTSIAGLLPLTLSSQSLWRPFCYVVIFGLGASMVMTLIVIPALYRLTNRDDAKPAGEPQAKPGLRPPALREPALSA